ncbi:MAG: glycosyltransferase family 4 protein [Verrucomicrobia bacterium]|nr:glycosyltransferase family 4 protein [Verrucomicrobiota bacterium]
MKQSRVLIVTPGFKGGSWTRLRDIIRQSPSTIRYTVVGYGARPTDLPDQTRIWAIPYFEYSTKLFLAWHPFIAVLFSLPLVIAAWMAFVLFRPAALLCNGLVLAFSMIPLARLARRKILVSYHGWTEFYVAGIAAKMTTWLSRYLETIYANSDGSRKDLCRLIDPHRIAVSEHYADPIFFALGTTDESRQFRDVDFADQCVIAYVGRIVEETNVGLLVRSLPRLMAEFPAVTVVFCGQGGALVDAIRQAVSQFPNRVYYFGYLKDRLEVRRLYQLCAAVWSCGDDTYLTRPAVESLACGTPIIIPDRPNITRKRELTDARVPATLVPASVGCLVDAEDTDAAVAVVGRIASGQVTFDAAAIRTYAERRYSISNLDNILDGIRAACETVG